MHQGKTCNFIFFPKMTIGKESREYQFHVLRKSGIVEITS